MKSPLPPRPWLSYVAGGLLAATLIYTYIAPPAKGFMSPDLARILFFHLPCALVSSIIVWVGAFWAVKTLSNPSESNELRLSTCWEMATILAVLTLTTGILFSRVQWGEWWNWDPRQVSYLFVTLLLLGGLALRAGISDDSKRATALAGYSLVMMIPIAFLTFVYPRLPQVRSLHPSTVIQQGALDSSYRMGVMLGMLAVGAAATLLWRRRVWVGELEIAWRNRDGKSGLESSGGDSGSHGDRRAVVVPREH